MQAKLTGVLAVAAAAVLVAGCGGGGGRLSKAEYEQKVQADGKSVQKAFSNVNAGSASALTGLAKQIPAARQALEKAIADLDKAKPPKDAEADNHTIVVALRTIDAQLTKLAAAAKKGDIAALQSAGAAIQNAPEIKAAQRAAKDLKRKGYKIGVLGQT